MQRQISQISLLNILPNENVLDSNREYRCFQGYWIFIYLRFFSLNLHSRAAHMKRWTHFSNDQHVISFLFDKICLMWAGIFNNLPLGENMFGKSIKIKMRTVLLKVLLFVTRRTIVFCFWNWRPMGVSSPSEIWDSSRNDEGVRDHGIGVCSTYKRWR